MGAAETSIRVTRKTLIELGHLGEVLQTGTVDQTIQRLIRERRSRALAWLYGRGKGAVRRFTEADRIEAHD